MNWGKTPPPVIKAELMDCGRVIGVGVEFNGKRKAVRIPNPLWEEINAEWQKAHSA